MKISLLLFMLVYSQLTLFAQQDAWVYLKDKQNVESSIANPISILSQKAINRKSAHGVPIDARDVPVNEGYISQLKNATSIAVMAKSKWFNAVHVRGNQTNIEALNSLNFVSSIQFADRSLNLNKSVKQKKQSKFESNLTSFNYGSAAPQVEMINANQLHIFNYTGAGMTVAVMDGGFPNVNTMTSFNRLRNTGKVLGTYDFVNRDNDVYSNTTSQHGTLVLSTMAGYIENQYVGTAPDATYYLFITEDDPTENPVEESYWVEAAERADSLGVDVINTSLGYKNYDNPNYSYTSADLDGNTAFITKGANIAFQKGMLLVNSAGNSGSNGVGAPADAIGVFSIGAVDVSGNYASFSSEGSAIQPSIKPDVVAQGKDSVLINENDAIVTADGTSFSSPILAGGLVCLWQALHNKTNAQIMQLVRESASQYSMPDYQLGYGIPDLQAALNLGLSINENDKNDVIKVFPNPTTNMIYFKLPASEEIVSATVFDMLGKQVFQTSVTPINNKIDLLTLSKGLYMVNLKSGNISKTFKVIKQ